MFNEQKLAETVGSANGSAQFGGAGFELAFKAVAKLSPTNVLVFFDGEGSGWVLHIAPDVSVVCAARFPAESATAFSVMVDVLLAKRIKKTHVATLSLTAGRKLDLSLEPDTTKKGKATRANVSVAAQNGLAKVVADRVTHNLSLSSTDNLLLSNDCWQAIVASIRRLDILAFFTARKERLDIYACSQPDGNLYVYCADKASLGAVACPAPEGTGEFTTVLTADALAVIGLLFDIDMEEDGADAADMVANVSLALTNTGFLVYNEAALLYMPSPRVFPDQTNVTLPKVQAMYQHIKESYHSDDNGGEYSTYCDVDELDPQVLASSVKFGADLIEDAAVRLLTGTEEYLIVEMRENASSIQSAIPALISSSANVVLDPRLLGQAVINFKQPVRLKVESKFTVLHAFVQELDGEHFILIGNQRE